MKFPDPAGAWDDGLRSALQRAIPASVLTERAWRIARLPFCFGGLSVCAIVDYADTAFAAAHINVMALVRSHCPRATGLFQDLALLTQPGDRTVMNARVRILLRAPDAVDVIDAYFASPVLDMSTQEKIKLCIASREHALLLQVM